MGTACAIAVIWIFFAVFPGAFDHSSDPPVTAVATGFRPVSNSSVHGTITVNVKASGSLRDVIGGPSVKLTVTHGTTVAELSARLANRYLGLAPTATLAVDGGSEILPPIAVLTDGQSVELIPPTSGG